MTRHARPLLAALAVVALTVVGCGGGEPAASGVAVHRGLAIVHPSEGSVPPLHPSVDDYPEATVGLERPDGQRSVAVAVKVAHTAEQRRHGLMEVSHLPDGVGMAFLFTEDRGGGFWMKDTRIPLDIAWAAADGRIVDIQRMEPCTADPCPVYTPDEQYRNALEVPAGWFGKVGVAEGWRLVLPAGLPPPE